jgi:hypothetical protein
MLLAISSRLESSAALPIQPFRPESQQQGC